MESRLNPVDSPRAGQEIQSRTVHRHVRKSPPLVCIFARQIQSTPSHPTSLRRISVLSPTRVHNKLPQVLPTKIWYVFLVSPTPVACPTHFSSMIRNNDNILSKGH